MLWGKIKVLLLNLLVIMFFTSCGESGEKSLLTSTSTPLSEITDIESVSKLSVALSSISINNTEELADNLITKDPLDLLLELKAVDNSIQAEDVLTIMKDLEREVLIKPLLADNKISQKSFDSLKIFDSSVDSLKSTTLREWNSPNEDEPLSQEATQEFIKQQWIAYNNELSAFGEEQLSLEEFTLLRSQINNLIPLFINFTESMQNVPSETSTVAPASLTTLRNINNDTTKVTARDVVLTPVTLNPVDESIGALDISPTNFLNFKPHQFMACQGIEREYPFKIMGTTYAGDFQGSPIYSMLDTAIPLLGNENEKRFFQINETGIAELLLFNKSNQNITIEFEHNDKVLFTTTIESLKKQKVFIPIFEEDVCVPYYMTKDDDNIEATIRGIKKPRKLEKEFDAQSGAYDIVATVNSNPDFDNFPNIDFFEFSLLENDETSNRVISFTDENLGYAAIQYIIKSPSGKLISTVKVGSEDLSVNTENGKWLIYAIPMIGAQFDEYEIDETTNEITSLYVMNESDSEIINKEYKVSLRTSELSNRKKFIISEMKNAEFSHDGESKGLSAEVKLSLHTNMAPKLDMGADLNALFNEDPSYPAYKCWSDNGRDVDLFDENQACYETYDSLENILDKYLYDKLGINEYSENYLNFKIQISNDDFKKSLLVWYENEMAAQLNDERFRLIFDTYTDLYEEWENSTVQINDMKFPLAYHYGIQDSIAKAELINGEITTTYDTFYHPNIPLNIPILGLTKERMAMSTMPFGFQYSAYDNDEVDQGDIFAAIAKYVVNQALAALSGNFSALICNTISTMGEIRSIQIAGEDEPLGEADFFLNRFSSNDQFYGIQNNNLSFPISGLADVPNHYTSADEALGYANLVCSAVGTVSAGYNLYNSVGGIISGDYYNAADLDNVKEAILGELEEGSDAYNKILNTFDSLKDGTADAASLAALEYSIKTAAFGSGIDIFNSLSDLNDNLGGLGSEGYNTMRSEANYYYSSFDNRKTRSNIEIKEVESMPIVDTKVTLNKVEIIHNLEDGNAEVKLRTRVGVISDENPTYNGSFASNAPYMLNGELMHTNGTDDYKTLPNLPFKGYLLRNKNFNGITDGEVLNISSEGLELYNASYSTTNNMASIYIEIGLFEGDGGGVDDDMIGVLSNNFYLEDMFNEVDGRRWSHMGNNVYRLTVTDYPVYDAKSLASSVEVVDIDNRNKQLEHNRNRIYNPSALISFQIDVELGEFEEHEEVDVDNIIIDGDPTNGKESMDYSLLNLKEKSSISTIQTKAYISDVFNNKVLLHTKDEGMKVANIDEYKNLSWGITLSSDDLADEHKDILETNRYYDFERGRINGTSFIDQDHLLVFKRSRDEDEPTAKMAIINIKEGDTFGTVSKYILYEEDLKPTYITTQRINDEKIRAYMIFSKPDENIGQISVYDITSDTIELKSYQALPNTPVDLLIIDDETILLKSGKIKTIGDEYWRQEQYLTIYKYENDTFNAKDIKQYTFKHNSYSKGTGSTSNPAYLVKRMNNINNSILNRIVNVRIYHENYYNYSDSVYIKRIKLLYNADTQSYRFGLKHDSKIYNAEYIENDQYPYFIDTNLNIYPSDQSRDKLDITDIFGEDLYLAGKNIQFLDSRYLLTYGHLYPRETYNKTTLSIVDTFHVDNTAPTITGDDLDKEHIIEYSNNFHTEVDFKVNDNESLASDLDITFTVMNPETDEEYYTGTNTADENFLQVSKLTCDEEGNCTISVDIALHDTSSKTKFRINVEDDGLVSHRYFTTWLAKSQPEIYASSDINVTLKDEDTYNEVDLQIVSQNEIANGYIDEFIVENKPDWLVKDVFIYGSKTLSLKGTPPMGSAGTYTIKVTAKNDRYEDIKNYTINVIEPDTTPDSFSFEQSNDVELETVVIKEFVVSGINGYAPISITNGEYQIDDNDWTSQNSLVTNTSLIKVRHTSSAEYSTQTISTLTVGGETSQLVSITITDPNSGDFTPNQFTFSDVSNVNLSTRVSSSITISGINETVDLSILSGEYSLNNKDWSSENTTVENEQMVYVRHTSSDSYSTKVNTILTVGGVSDTFTSTTIDIPIPALIGQMISDYEVDDLINLNIDNSGGEASSWSIQNKPDWMTFNTSTGNLSGTAQAGYFANITITATNSSGSDDFTFNLSVNSKNAPYIDGGSHTLDEEEMEFTFTDDSSWREAITEITLQIDYGAQSITLVENSDYTIESGILTLIINGTNNIPTTAGYWQVNIKATNYYDNTVYIYAQNGSIGTTIEQTNINVLNAPLRQGAVSTIEFQPLDRFGNIMKNKEVYFDVVITNTNLNFIEPYLIKGINETNYHDFIRANYSPTNRHSFFTDEEGWVKVQIKIPGCIDVGDGFYIVLKDSNTDTTIVNTTDAIKDSLKLDNTRSTCTDIDWKKRFVSDSIYNMKLLTDTAGNIYLAGETTADIEGTTNLNRDIYLSKIDRNGVTRWEKLLGTSEIDNFSNFILDGENLYLALTTSGLLDGNTNQGGSDAGLLKISASDGSLVYAKQVGDTNDDLAIGISKTDKINLYANIDNNSYIYKFNEDGTLNSTKNLNASLDEVKASDENNHIALINKSIQKYATNGDFLLSRSNVGGAVYSNRGVFNIFVDTNNIYTVGQTKLKLFDEEVINDTYHGTIVKRNKDGNYQWSKILGTGEIITVGGTTTMNDVTYTIYTQKNSSTSTSPRNMHLEILNDKNGSSLGSYTWEAGTTAYNAINAQDIISDFDKHSIYIAADVYGDMEGTNTSDGLNVIIKKQQYDAPVAVTGYARSDYLNLVTDYDNNLQWVDDSNNIPIRIFDNAANACSNDIYVDSSINPTTSVWRLPTQEELERTIDSNNTPAIKSIFENTVDNTAYWTSEETSDSFAIAFFYWGSGGEDAFSKTDSLNIRCVRDNQ